MDPERLYLSLITGCDVTEDRNLEEILDSLVASSKEMIAEANKVNEYVKEYEKSLQTDSSD